VSRLEPPVPPSTSEGSGFPPEAHLDPTLRVPSSGGAVIAGYELAGGGSAPLEVLAAHATGFCAAVFAPLARELDTRRVVGFDERGHGASTAAEDRSFAWSGFADDALAVVDAAALHRPFGFGHSCGGAALLLAEIARPGTFAALYLFEPVVPPILEPVPGGLPDNPLSVGARRRRERFGSRDEALANFAGKAPFNQLTPEVLAAYVDNGFRAVDGAIELCCRREDEAAVYQEAFAHDAFRRLPEVHCPVTVACGALTDSFPAAALAPVVDRLPDADLVVLPDLGHFGPLEDPAVVARSVRASAAWSAASGSAQIAVPPTDPAGF
jgi:pimeloyl-ACP methyl ester carboxylesterase